MAAASASVPFLILWIVFGSGQADPKATLSPEARVVRMLSSLPNYDKRVRPVKNSSQPIIVGVNLFPRTLVYLNDEKQRISMGGYFDLFWKDEYICWNPDDYDGIKRVVMPDTNIWKPDVIPKDSLGGIDDTAYVTGPIDLVLAYDGNVTWFSNRVFVKSCNLDMTYFPFDKQKCQFIYESRTHDGRTMRLEVKQFGNEAVSIDGLKENPDGQWKFVAVDAVIKTAVDSDNWSSFVATMTLQRKPMYFIMNILCPSIMISFLIPIMFCLPPESGERMSVGTTILLAFSVFQMVIAETLPKTSDTIPIIVNYLLIMMGTSALSIILTVIILHLHLNRGVTLPRWLRLFLFGCLAKILCMSRDVEETMKKSELSKLSRDNSRFEVYANQVDDVTHVFKHVFAREGNVKVMNSETIQMHLSRMNKTLDEFLSLKREKIEKENSRGLWILAARILDRFFLIIYLIINIVAAAIFFGTLPADSLS